MESIIFLGMNPDMWIVLLTILVVFGLMLFTKLPGDYVFMGSMVVFVTTGVLPVDEALSSFSSESVIMTGALFVIIADWSIPVSCNGLSNTAWACPRRTGRHCCASCFPWPC